MMMSTPFASDIVESSMRIMVDGDDIRVAFSKARSTKPRTVYRLECCQSPTELVLNALVRLWRACFCCTSLHQSVRQSLSVVNHVVGPSASVTHHKAG